MTLREETITIAEEIERLESELQETAEKVAGLSDDNPRKTELLQEGQQLDAELEGIRWAQRAHEDENVTVWNRDVETLTLAGLTGGEFGEVEDGLVEDGTTGQGATRVFLVERGTVDAPYVEDGMTEEERIAAVSQLPITFLKWAEARVNEFTTLGGNGSDKRFEDWLQEAQAKQNSTGN